MWTRYSARRALGQVPRQYAPAQLEDCGGGAGVRIRVGVGCRYGSWRFRCGLESELVVQRPGDGSHLDGGDTGRSQVGVDAGAVTGRHTEDTARCNVGRSHIPGTSGPGGNSQSLETGAQDPVGYINPANYKQHNLAVEDGLEGLLAIAGRCGLPSAGQLGRIDEFRGRDPVLARAETFLGSWARDPWLQGRGYVSH